jgi:hypothetical protein
MCNSACVLIWIAGSYRHLDRHARLGFHSGSHTETGKRLEEANEKIAIYMKQMGAPQPMIDLQPKADPCCINFVDFPQAGPAEREAIVIGSPRAASFSAAVMAASIALP